MDAGSIVLVTAIVILFTVVSGRLDGTSLTAPLFFTVAGWVAGESVLGVFHLPFTHGFLHTLAEVTLILVLFSDAARIELREVRRDHDLPIRLLVVGLPLTIVLGTLAAWQLPLGLNFWEAALLATILAPTDAALGQVVVTSHVVPQRIRQALNIESGLNDGIALPLVLVCAAFAGAMGEADGDTNWLLLGGMQVTLGPLVGVLIGLVTARLIDRAAISEWMAESFQGAAILAVPFLAFAGAELVGGNGFIAAFVAGMVFGNTVRGRCAFIFEFAESETQLLMLFTFFAFGAVLIGEGFQNLNGMVFLYAIFSLTVFRMLPSSLALLGTGLRLPSQLFLGWFGPRGLASILFALFVMEDFMIAAAPQIFTVVVVTVTLSVLLHGITAAPAAKAFGRLSARYGTCPEAISVSEMPVRHGLRPKTIV